MIRLMRNILCHEHYIDYRSIEELYYFSIDFFKTEENLKKCFEYYFENCSYHHEERKSNEYFFNMYQI